MNWSEPKPPINNVSYYDHVKLDTPLGEMMIEWKSWKNHPSYDIMLSGEYIGVEYDLEAAKLKASEHLKYIYTELGKLLSYE